MKVKDVQSYVVLMELDAEDCRLAEENLASRESEQEAQYITAAGAAFRACAAAALGQHHMGSEPLGRLHQTFEEVGLWA